MLPNACNCLNSAPKDLFFPEDLCVTCTQPVDGQLGAGKLTTPDLFGPLKGLGIINLKDQIDNGGLIYLVILTKDHPEGEMRGQLISAENPYATDILAGAAG